MVEKCNSGAHKSIIDTSFFFPASLQTHSIMLPLPLMLACWQWLPLPAGPLKSLCLPWVVSVEGTEPPAILPNSYYHPPRENKWFMTQKWSSVFIRESVWRNSGNISAESVTPQEKWQHPLFQERLQNKMCLRTSARVWCHLSGAKCDTVTAQQNLQRKERLEWLDVSANTRQWQERPLFTTVVVF